MPRPSTTCRSSRAGSTRGTHADQRTLRTVVPDNRLRTYEIRDVIDGLADTGSVLELRRGFGLGMVTALVRIEGRPVGILANDPNHLAGAIDSDGSDKAARFMQLCDAFDIPLVVLCDTPGIMVGPEIEKTGLVRHCNRLFITGANLSIPMFMVVVRKAYGLGALAMAGGSVMEPFFCVAWPTGEFAGMGLEGQIKLGYRNELVNIADPAERKARFDHLVAEAYERSKAIHQGVVFGVDDVIDPMDTRHWLANGLRSVAGRRRPDVPHGAVVPTGRVPVTSTESGSALEVGHRAAARPDEVGGGDGEDVVPRAGGGPDVVEREQVGVDEHGQRRGVPERRDATDRVAGRRADRVGVDPGAVPATRRRGELALVELVGAADVREHDVAVDGEDQALHDLADLDADRRGRVGRRLGPVGEAHRLDRQPEVGRRGDHSMDVGMPVRLRGHGSGTVAGPADASTRDPLNEHTAATRYDVS